MGVILFILFFVWMKIFRNGILISVQHMFVLFYCMLRLSTIWRFKMTSKLKVKTILNECIIYTQVHIAFFFLGNLFSLIDIFSNNLCLGMTYNIYVSFSTPQINKYVSKPKNFFVLKWKESFFYILQDIAVENEVK